MTEYSEEFKARFRPAYGHYGRDRPDFARCAATVGSGSVWHGSKQCSRKNGHGPDGAFCKQHDPQAIAAKRNSELAARKKAWANASRKAAFIAEAQDAIRAIAEGHNDPMTLAREILARYEGKA